MSLKAGTWKGSVLAGSVAALLWAASAGAQSNQNAEELFRQGRELLAAQRFAEACPSLAASYRLDPALGTLLNLAVCHQGLGKTATAWSEFKAVAEKDSGERAAFAAEQVKALAPTLPRVVIRVASEMPKMGLVVRLDGVAVEPSALAKAVPVDPGHHTISVEAPDMKPWQSAIDAQAGAAPVELSVLLEGQHPATPPPADNRENEAAANAARAKQQNYVRAGVLAGEGALAAAGLIIGVTFALKADSSGSDARRLRGDIVSSDDPNPCRGSNDVLPAGCSSLRVAVDDRASYANTAALGFVGAGVGVAAFLGTMFLWKPARAEAGWLELSPMAVARGAGLNVVWTH